MDENLKKAVANIMCAAIAAEWQQAVSSGVFKWW